jgi:hypothetical protein
VSPMNPRDHSSDTVSADSSAAVRSRFSGLRTAWPVPTVLALALLLEVLPLPTGAASTAVAGAQTIPVSSIRLVCASSPNAAAPGLLTMAAVPIAGAPQPMTAADSDAAPAATDPIPALVRLSLVVPDGDGQLVTDSASDASDLGDPLQGAGSSDVAVAAGAPPILIEGLGALAPVTEAALSLFASRGDDRGLAEQTCERPTTSWWFAGGSSTLGHTTRIVITNVEDAPASMDIRVLGTSGLQTASGGRGLAVAARSRVELRLDELAPEEVAAAINVRVNSGRVHVAVLKRILDGPTPEGIEWLPRVQPQGRLVIPVPPGLSAPTLVIAPIGKAPSRIEVRVRTEEGSFVPLGLEVLNLDADTVRTVDLTDALDDGGAVEIDSDVPVVATVLARAEAGGEDIAEADASAGLGDILAMGPASVLTTAAILTGLRSDARHVLQIVGLGAAGAVDIITMTSNGSTTTERVAVKGATVVTHSLAPSNASGSLTVIVLPGTAIAANIMSMQTLNDGVVASIRQLRTRSVQVTRPAAYSAIGLTAPRDTRTIDAR